MLFNLGLIAVAAPVQVSPLTRTLDWPFLVGSTWLATPFFWRGGVSRRQGGLLLALYAGYGSRALVSRRFTEPRRPPQALERSCAPRPAASADCAGIA